MLFNPMAAFGDRLTGIAKECKSDLAILPETNVQNKDSHMSCATFKLAGTRCTAWQWGYRKGPLSGRSCGITIVLGPRLRNYVVAVLTPPVHLAGRAAGIRIRTATTDILAIGIYFPPKTDSADQAIAPCVRAILAWIGKILHNMPTRTIPMIMGDFNTKFGKDGNGNIEADETVGQSKFGVRETFTSRALR